MSTQGPTLGQAIDSIVAALQSLEPHARTVAIHAACAHLGLESSASSNVSAQTDAVPPVSRQSPAPGATKVDIRSLKEAKQPKTAKQMACLVAYYLQEIAADAERQMSVNTADMEKYFKQAGFRLPAKLKQLLIDAKDSGYFESVGRGQYALNAVGYNLVAHGMPAVVGAG
jgi:hypothetical protein